MATESRHKQRPLRTLIILFAVVLIGVSESVAGILIAPSMKSMFSFALLILVLAFRPQGLFSRR